MYENESSIPVTSRISVQVLAEIDRYWISEGYQIKTMSQLVSWSLELLKSILVNNGKMKEIDTVREAHEWMVRRGLYQMTVSKRGFMKIGNALRFESMREEGINPKEYVTNQFNVVNRKNAVQPLPDEAKANYISPFDADWEKAKKLKEEEEIENRKKIHEAALEAAKANGLVIDETKASINQTVWEREKKERDYLKKLNATPEEQIEFMKKQGLIKE